MLHTCKAATHLRGCYTPARLLHICKAATQPSSMLPTAAGQFIDYMFLHSHFHRLVSSRIAMNATYNSRKSILYNIGVIISLTYQQFVRACTGYAQMIEFKKEDFLCVNCGDSPKYIVCDGKTDGPTKRKVEHLHELDRPEHDESYLCQGSFFEDRVFLSEKRERALVCNLLTNVISEEECVEWKTCF
jgi:hypothetical protein